MSIARPETLVLDERITPRANDEATDVMAICDAIDAGVTLPPILVDRASRRVVDGRRRLRAWKRKKYKHVSVTYREFNGLGEMLLAAVAANADHGLGFNRVDQLAMLRRAAALGVPLKDVAAALLVPPNRLEELVVARTAYDAVGTPVSLKPATAHLAQGVMTPRQVEANRSLGGGPAVSYINRVIDLVEADLLDRSNVGAMSALNRLYGLLTTYLQKEPVLP